MTSRLRADALTLAARSLHEEIVAAARRPEFYGEGRTPDTLEGRFDMVSFYGALAMIRLRGEGEAARALSQRLFDIMFKEFDDGLRSLGVGDTSVPKRIKKMAGAFYGRLKAYDDALAADDDAALGRAVGRNILGDEDHPAASALAVDGRRFFDALRARGIDALLDARVRKTARAA